MNALTNGFHMWWRLLAILVTPVAVANTAVGAELVGLWHFDEDTADATGSWSPFGRYSHGEIDRGNPRVGSGAYAAEHGEDSESDWRDHATGRIRLTNHAVMDGAETFGMALWVRPVKIWAKHGRVFSFGRGAFGLANIPGEPGSFRFVDPGFAEEGVLSPLELPMGEWSHLAVTADGKTVRVILNGVLVDEVPQTGPLNAGEQLYLGAMDSGGVGLLGTHIDELILTRDAVSADWAMSVFSLTKTGEPYPFDLPPPAPFEPVERDASKFLRVTSTEVQVAVGEAQHAVWEFTETPLLGGYIPSGLMSGEQEVLEVIDDLKAHHCNTIVVGLAWCITRPSLLQLFHENDFRVFVLISPPYGVDFVREVPDAAQRDEEGNALPTASFYDPRFIQDLRENFLAEGLDGRGLDGLILDEPSHRDYRIALREGRLYHDHPAEREAYEQMYGEPMPSLDLADAPQADDYRRLMAFRQQMIHDWLELIEEVVWVQAGELDYHIVLTPDNVTNYKFAGYLRGREATGIDVERLLESDGFDGIQITAYMNAWGGKDPEWVEGFVPLFKDRAHEQGKSSIFWAQAYLESPEQVERGITEGNIGSLVDLTLGQGVDGVLLWSYRGFSQDGYGWDAFFDEFADAAEPYLDRPADGLVFETFDPEISVEAVPRGAGAYEVEIYAAKPGDYTLLVRNRAGVENEMKIRAR